MYCSHCGSLLAENNQYCPSCGEKNDVNIPVPLIQVKKGFPWKKWLVVLLFVMFLILSIFYIASKDLTESVEGQLKALRTDKVTEAYYSYTAKAFQKNISLEKFREFIKSYPALFRNQSIQFTDSAFEDGVLILKGTLTSTDKQTLNIEYKLIDEDGDWKILSIELLKNAETTLKTTPQQLSKNDFQSLIKQQLRLTKTQGAENNLSSDHKPLKVVVDQQLSALSTGKIQEAYHLTAKEFQQNTPFELFVNYIQEFPLLRHHDSVTYGQSLVEEEIGVIEVELYQTGKAMTVDYALKQEKGIWKIWGMQINQTVQKGELVSQ